MSLKFMLTQRRVFLKNSNSLLQNGGELVDEEDDDDSVEVDNLLLDDDIRVRLAEADRTEETLSRLIPAEERIRREPDRSL